MLWGYASKALSWLFICSLVFAAVRESALGTQLPAWANSDEFCPTRAAIVPWDTSINDASATTTSDRYFINLWTTARKHVYAKVLMFSKTAVYSIEVSSSELGMNNPDSPNRYSAPVEILFDQPVELLYNFVDTTSIDGAMESCPSYVEGVPSYSAHPAVAPHYDENTPPTSAIKSDLMKNFRGSPVVHPKFVQTVSVPCGRMYRGPHLVQGGAVIGQYGDRQRLSLVETFIDASGRVRGTRLEKSSGVDGIDQAALGAAQGAIFLPAEFLCTPVVSTYFLWVYYNPQ
jgi:hypothetical protein